MTVDELIEKLQEQVEQNPVVAQYEVAFDTNCCYLGLDLQYPTVVNKSDSEKVLWLFRKEEE